MTRRALPGQVRDDVDFAVGDPDALPFGDDTFELVVLEAGDGIGPFDASALDEARRVLAPGGALIWRAVAFEPGVEPLAAEGPYAGARP